MSLQDEREQCLRDINALNSNLKEIEKRIEAEKEAQKPKGFCVWRLCVEPYKTGISTDKYFRIGIICSEGQEKMMGFDCHYREAFSTDDIRQIIRGLQKLIGENSQ